MKAFDVYKHPTLGYKAVKSGFSWPGFIFGIIWMLIKKLWWQAIFFFFLYFICAIVENVTLDDLGKTAGPFIMVIYVVLWITPGIVGNEWLSAKLASRGYELISSVRAETADGAVAQVAKAEIELKRNV